MLKNDSSVLAQDVPAGEYFPALDGLRGLMALGVVIAHVNLQWFPGAPIMMDVFFVISGFLITLILHRNIQRSGRLQLIPFWKRRLLRLYPALLVVVVSYVAVAACVLDNLWPVLRDALETLLYVSNWSKLYEYTYPPIFGHSWSLSIEEQFYLLWPLLLLGAIRLGLQTRGIATALILIALLVVAWRLWLVADEAPWSRLYYALETRMDAFIVGAVLALGWQGWKVRWAHSRWLHRGLYVGAGALLGMLVFGRPREIEYFVWQQSLVLLLSATILLLSSPRVSLLGRFFGSPPCVALGVRCYSIYLWHWPIIWLLLVCTQLDKLSILMITLPLTLLLSAVTYRYVEAPVLAKRMHYANWA